MQNVGFLSVNIDFAGRDALLVGAGKVGRRKLADLLKAGARVAVAEPAPCRCLVGLAGTGAIALFPEFSESLLDRGPWVFIALDDSERARGLAGLARGRGLMVEVAGSPSDGNFQSPALVDFPPLRLTVSTGGASPALSARVAAELRERYAGSGALAAMLGRLRPLVAAGIPSDSGRGLVYKTLAGDPDLAGLYRDLAAGGAGLSATDLAARIRSLLERRLAPLELPPDFPLP